MAASLNVDNETFVVYVVTLAELISMPIYLSCQTQVALLTSEKTEIPVEYSNFSNIFFSDSAAKLLENTRINNHFINLLNNK